MPTRDVQWVIGTIVVLTGLLMWRVDAGFSGVHTRIDDVNTRIDDVNTRIDDVNTNLTAQIAGVNARIDDLRDELKAEIAVLRDDVRSLDTRLRAVENALAKVDQRLLTIERVVLPGLAAGE